MKIEGILTRQRRGKPISRALAAAAFSLMAAAPAFAQPPAPPLPITEQLRETCRAVKAVDRRRLTDSDAGTATYHPEARAGAAAPPPGHVGPVIRLFVHHSSPPPAPSSSVVAWKMPDGRWHATRIVYAPPPGMAPPALPWPHDPGIALDDLPRSDWHVRQGTFAAADADRLERLLASNCLEREPAVRPHELPVRRGPVLTCYWHPTRFHLELSDRGRTRSLLRLCNHWQNASGSPAAGRWASDLVADLLSSAALEGPAEAAAPSVAATQIPERFRGRWAQRPAQCAEEDGVWFQVVANGVSVRGVPRAADGIEQRGPRTLILHGPGPALLHDVPMDRYSQPLLLSPAGDRLVVPDRMTGWDMLLHRCPPPAP
jgi:hypothetical protein